MQTAIKRYKAAMNIQQDSACACNTATALLGLRNGWRRAIELEQDDIRRAAPEAPTEAENEALRDALDLCGSQYQVVRNRLRLRLRLGLRHRHQK